MSFKSWLVRRLTKRVEPLGYVCVSLWLPLVIAHAHDDWIGHNVVSFWIRLAIVFLSTPLWVWKTLQLLDEVGWRRFWITPICLPVTGVILSEIGNRPKLEGTMIALQLLMVIGLMIPGPRAENAMFAEHP